MEAGPVPFRSVPRVVPQTKKISSPFFFLKSSIPITCEWLNHGAAVLLVLTLTMVRDFGYGSNHYIHHDGTRCKSPFFTTIIHLSDNETGCKELDERVRLTEQLAIALKVLFYDHPITAGSTEDFGRVHLFRFGRRDNECAGSGCTRNVGVFIDSIPQ